MHWIIVAANNNVFLSTTQYGLDYKPASPETCYFIDLNDVLSKTYGISVALL